MPDASPSPPGSLAGNCACTHLACDHPRGKCPDLPVVVEDTLGRPTKLCARCVERWGYHAPSTKKGA
jgi:hypothetical protein